MDDILDAAHTSAPPVPPPTEPAHADPAVAQSASEKFVQPANLTAPPQSTALPLSQPLPPPEPEPSSAPPLPQTITIPLMHPPKKNKGGKVALFSILFLLVLTIPIIVYYAKQPKQIADVRSQAKILCSDEPDNPDCRTSKSEKKEAKCEGATISYQICSSDGKCMTAQTISQKGCGDQNFGNVTQYDCTAIDGIAADSKQGSSVNVVFYDLGIGKISQVTANQYGLDEGLCTTTKHAGKENEKDVDACKKCRNDPQTTDPICRHGFTWKLPVSLKDGLPHYIVPMVQISGGERILSGVPTYDLGDGKVGIRPLTCGTPPTPTPTSTITPTPTPTPTITPTPTPAPPQCKNIKIYKGTSVVDPSTLKVGDDVVIAIAGLNATKARIRINDSEWVESETKNSSSEFTAEFTIPSGPLTFTVEAEVFKDNVWQ